MSLAGSGSVVHIQNLLYQYRIRILNTEIKPNLDPDSDAWSVSLFTSPRDKEGIRNKNTFTAP